MSEREEEVVEEVGSVFDQDGGSLQTWGPLASQDRQKASKIRAGGELSSDVMEGKEIS